MTSKQVPRPKKAKSGQLKVEWGKIPYERPDICYLWGPGVEAIDFRLIYSMFSGLGLKDKAGLWREDGYLGELQRRGYDLTTLKFSIQKKRKTH